MSANYLKIVFLFLVVNLQSCKKEPIPIDSEETPVFTFSGLIDGNQVDLKAGQNDSYLFSSFSQDQNGLKTYSAEFKTVNCASNCINNLKISFIDYAFSSPNLTINDSTFYPGNYNFATPSGKASRYNVAFTKTSIGGVVSNIIWDFGDGNSTNSINASHNYTRPGRYEVCMNANFNSGCISNLCHNLTIGSVGSFIEANLTDGTAVGTSIPFSASGNLGTTPYSYVWDFGDGSSSTNQNLVHAFPSEGVYTVSLTVTDALGISERSKQNVRTQNSNECLARFSHSVNPITNPNNFGNIVVEWTDAAGIVYTSKNDSQPLKSEFKVISIEEYNLNENGQKTKKMKVQFSCTLYNGANSIELKNAIAIIAVAYE